MYITRHQQVLNAAVDLCAKLKVDTDAEVHFTVDGVRLKATMQMVIQSGLEEEIRQAVQRQQLKRSWDQR